MKAGTEWNEERNENRMRSVNYHARHAHYLRSHGPAIFAVPPFFAKLAAEQCLRSSVREPRMAEMVIELTGCGEDEIDLTSPGPSSPKKFEKESR